MMQANKEWMESFSLALTNATTAFGFSAILFGIVFERNLRKTQSMMVSDSPKTIPAEV